MKEFCYVIVNNAGHSWRVIRAEDNNTPPAEPTSSALPQLLQEGWAPVRETPMGGGTSQLAHSLVLLEKNGKPGAKPRRKG